MSLGLGERDDEIVGLLEYDDTLFTDRTTAQMLEDYISLLTLIVADPAKSLETVALVSVQETEQLSATLVGNLEL